VDDQRVRIEGVASRIVNACLAVHRALGPGLLESTYQTCLAHELRGMGLRVDVEIMLPVRYRDLRVEAGYRIDMLVEDLVVVENKAVQALLPIHEAQLLPYLRLSGKKLGFLINWNVARIKDGIHRRVNNL
jgi:GxxExxY protein